MHNLTIHIIESAQNFAESTVVSPVYTEQEQNSGQIYIGNLEKKIRRRYSYILKVVLEVGHSLVYKRQSH